MRYEIEFTGRVKGAIGIFHPCREIVEAATEKGAIMELYRTHEHISMPKIKALPIPDAASLVA